MFTNTRIIFIVCIILFFIRSGFAQNQRIADSLIIELRNIDTGSDSLRLSLLHKIAFNSNNPDSSFYYAQLLEAEALKTQNQRYLIIAYANMGASLRMKGDLEQAIEAYFKSADIAKSLKRNLPMASAYSGIADIYSVSGAHENSILYYKKAISIQRNENDSISLASSIINAGDEFFNANELDSALVYFQESGTIFDLKNYAHGKAYNLGNVGMVYASMNKNDLAEENISEAIELLEKLEDYYAISEYLTYMSDIYKDKGDFNRALNYANKSLNLAKNYGLKDQISESNLLLSNLYQEMGKIEDSYKFYKNYIKYRDSINNLESIQKIADIRTNFEVSQKQTEVDLLDQKQQKQRITIIAGIISLLLISLLAVALFRRNIFIKKTSAIIQEERDVSNKLLRNILPEETAKELIENGKVVAKKINEVSVLFTDFKGFTKESEDLSPEELVESVNFYYSKFDQIVEEYGLEKIKTIGDSYMLAGGLPFPTKDHAVKIVTAAFEIAKFVSDTKKDDTDHIKHFDIRIGINTGPVVAGVVGIKKFAYDIWGDTVNIASRMESNSEPGKINISESTYQLIKDKFKCTYRGEIEVKNKGKLKMYFVDKALS